MVVGRYASRERKEHVRELGHVDSNSFVCHVCYSCDSKLFECREVCTYGNESVAGVSMAYRRLRTSNWGDIAVRNSHREEVGEETYHESKQGGLIYSARSKLAVCDQAIVVARI